MIIQSLKYLHYFLIFFLIITGCKKKKDEVANTPVVISVTNPANSSMSNGLPPNISNINGVFLANKVNLGFGTIYQSFASVNAVGNALQSINPVSILVVGQNNGGTLKINTTTLKFETSNSFELYRYTDTSSTANYSTGVIWDLNATGAFTSFSAAVSRGFPSIISTTFIPTSISKSSALTINFGLGNITNADSINVQINGPSLNLSKTVSSSATNINFTIAELSSATVGSGNAQFSVYVKNHSNMSVNNKTYVFLMFNTTISSANVTP